MAYSSTLLFYINRSSGAGGRQNSNIMYTLNFPNGNVQTYQSLSDLLSAARAFGGEAKQIRGNNYVFVPKK